MACFGLVQLEPGWWRLECETDAPIDAIEVRLRSAADPLIVFSAAGRDTDRVFLRAETRYDVTLLASPWPGEVKFRRLRLVRLSIIETLGLLGGGAVRALGRDKPLTRIMTVIRRLRSGHAIGVRLEQRATQAPAPTPVENFRELPARQTETHASMTVTLAKGDRLHPQAVRVVSAMFASNPNLHALYGDACRGGQVITQTGWDPLLARAGVFDDAPLFVRSGVASPLSLSAVAAQWDSSVVAHVALPLTIGPARARQPTPALPIPALARRPKVSVIIPTKLRIDLLEKCLDGLASRTCYEPLEVIVVDNGATDPRFLGVLDAARDRLALRVVEDHGSFNFSRLVNAGAAVANGEHLLLLNDDVEAIEPGWLDRMVEAADMPGVGAVGARLVYPDGSIQHAGVMMGLGGPCGHLWKGRSPQDADYADFICSPGRRMAVTGACLLVRRDRFQTVGGFDETFAVAFNDIDFCLRLRVQGFETIYRGDALLIHHESQTRGADHINHARRRRLASETQSFLDRWSPLTRDDPFGSPAFDPAMERGTPHRSLAGS